jgi:hypothetical protein
MASKVPQSRSTRPHPGGSGALREEAERLIAKERYKDAVKHAKLCYKDQATPENHRLLERAYFLRARQLLQQGMRSAAVEVAQHLLDFGMTGGNAPEDLIRLLAGLGFAKAAMALQEQSGAPGRKEQVTQAVADQLVLHPDQADSASPELAREARLVRQALEALQAADEAGAMGILRELPRSSPLSEWKFFVRGLAALERGDDGEARANWDRLDPVRAGSAIAERLRLLAADATGPPASSASLEAAERLAFGEPILGRIQQLGGLVAGHEWEKALSLLGSLRQGLRRIDPKLAERLTRVLIGSVIKAVQDMDWHEARSLIDRFCRVAQPLEIDPHWNRLWALVWDGPHAEPAGAIRFWTKYLEDLRSIAALSPAERALAQALVWSRIAGLHRDEVHDLIDEDVPPGLSGLRPKTSRRPGRESRALAASKKAVVEALEKSLRLAPEHLETYRLLVSIHGEWGDGEGLATAARRLLAKFPEDVLTLELLARHLYGRKDLRAALSLVVSARRLKPLDDSLRTLEWLIRVGLARQYALEKKWDMGRAEFAVADELVPGDRRDFSYMARKAMLEYKAGQAEQGDRYVQEAQETLVEPAPIWLALLIESVRFKMPKPTRDRYAKLWDAELKKKKRSETAGEMAGLMGAFLASDTEYTGRATHVKKLVDYLKKTTTLKYRCADIERVVEFLGELLPKERVTYERLVRANVWQHRDSVVLHLDAADVEMMSARVNAFLFGGIPYRAKQHLEDALKLAEASTDPKVTALLPMIRERLGSLEEVAQAMDRFGPPPGGMPFGPGPSFLDMMDYYDEDDFDDEDDFYEDDSDDDEPFTLDFGPAPKRSGSPGRRTGPKKRTRRKK